MDSINSFIQQAPTCLAFLDKNFAFTAISPGTLSLLETTEESLLKKDFFEAFQKSLKETEKFFIDRIKLGHTNSGKEVLQLANRGHVTIEWKLQRYTDLDDKHLGYLVHLNEISKRTKSEISHREILLTTILETIEIGMIACDKQGRLTLFNRAAREWHGLPEKDMPQEKLASFYNLYEPDEETLFEMENIPLLQVLKEGKIEHPDMFIKPKDGKNRHIKCNGSRLYSDDNEIIGAVVALYDITERKEAERKLQVSEKTFRGTFEHAAIGLSLTGLDGSCLEVNNALCEIMGYSKEELTQLNFREVTHPDDVGKDYELFEELLQGKRDFYQLEKRAYHKSGEIMHLFLSVSIVRNHQSEPLFFISQLIDITKKKNADMRVQAIAEITEEQNKRLKNFAYIVSHNLRSHSGNMSMLLELFADERPDMAENEFIKMISAASENLQKTIQHLNEVSQINTTIIENLEALPLRQAVEKNLNGLNALLIKENVEIHIGIPRDTKVLGLPAYLDSIIVNFTTNAIKYRSHERKPFIKFGAIKKDDYIQFTIEDNGLGIDLEQHGANLFGMYKTFHQNEDARGVGMFITKNQIEALGGKVSVESEENKGTIIKVHLKDAELQSSLDC